MPANLPLLMRALALWLLIMAAESLQGALRRWLASPEVEFAVRQASVLLSVGVIFAITWLTVRWLRLKSARQALAVGAVWAIATLVFEVALGRGLGLDWAAIAADYDLPHGGLMPLGLLAMALTPWAAWRIRGPQPQHAFPRSR